LQGLIYTGTDIFGTDIFKSLSGGRFVDYQRLATWKTKKFGLKPVFPAKNGLAPILVLRN